MLHRRRDFRPDKLPRRMKNWVLSWSMTSGYTRTVLKPRHASTRRQDFTNEHNNRQRTYNRKAIARELADWFEGDSDG